jgi:uncharacterized Zn finger protein
MRPGHDDRQHGWVERWRGLLGERDADVRRFNQGRAFQRSGRVTAVRVDPGRLVGRVQGSRATPYLVEVMVPQLEEAAWRELLALVAGQVRHAARLLAGQPPEGLEVELAERGVELFPPREDLDARCACGEADRPCAHVIALWEDLAERLEDDPFTVLRFRGRGRERLLAELAAARRRGGGAHEEGVAPGTLDVTAWSRARRDPAEIEVPPGAAPQGDAGPLRLLGDPPGWAGSLSAWDLFRPAVARAAERARDSG